MICGEMENKMTKNRKYIKTKLLLLILCVSLSMISCDTEMDGSDWSDDRVVSDDSFKQPNDAQYDSQSVDALTLPTEALGTPLAGNAVNASPFNWNNIAPHPRLLLTPDTEASLLESIYPKQNPATGMQQIHEHIIAKCNEWVTNENDDFLSGMEYHGEDVKRILSISQDVLKKVFYLSYCYRTTDTNVADADEYASMNASEYASVAKAILDRITDNDFFVNWHPVHYLDTAEMTMAAAIGLDWLWDYLYDYPDTKARLRSAIVTNAFEPIVTDYESHEFVDLVGGAKWVHSAGNWNQVCTASLSFGALAVYESNPGNLVNYNYEAFRVLVKAIFTNMIALESDGVYGTDGNYKEGAKYWEYGTTFQVMMMEAFNSALGSYGPELGQYFVNDNGTVHENSGFMKTAKYALNVFGPSGKSFNYSDGTLQQDLPALFWFANMTNDRTVLYHQSTILNTYRKSKYRLLPLAVIFGHEKGLSEIDAPSIDPFVGGGENSVFIARTGWDKNDKFLGVKGGKASIGHAHMDAGSFVYDAEGYRWAQDWGAENYYAGEANEPEFWNQSQLSARWRVFRLSNLNHSTISINDWHHKVDGMTVFKEYYTDSATALGAKLDMKDTLNRSSELSRAYRDIFIEDGKRLVVRDGFTALGHDVKIRWNMATPARTKLLDDSTVQLIQDSTGMLLRFSYDDSNYPEWVAPKVRIVPDANRSTKPSSSWESTNDNPPTVMVGFDATVGAGKTTVFKVTLEADPAYTPATVFVTTRVPII